jgi:hypothetical protein
MPGTSGIMQGCWSSSRQFAKGYNYPNVSVYNSRLMAPGYFQLSLGMIL